ncbi:MAG: T9SS type A sorting domain-containing protein [Ignavibacteriaceae bacterium]|nr:T9SS type A sorting domain-containing protein [Ignavibacteriaceae bacterium]
MIARKLFFFSTLNFFIFTSLSFAQVNLELQLIGRYETGLFDQGGSEIVAYDFLSKRLFSVNAGDNSLDVIDLSNPSSPVLLYNVDMSQYGGAANSVAVNAGIVAVAIENNDKQLPGKVVLFDVNGNFLNEAEVGSLPDMLTFTRNGRFLVVANEGEPNSNYSIDPEGSVSIIELKGRGKSLVVTNVTFDQFNGQEELLRQQGIRIYGPNASASEDFEPEYIAISDDDRFAYVTLQENNALAILDLNSKSILSIKPLGYKNHLMTGNELDASDKDNIVNITNWPVLGMYQPDGIAYFKSSGNGYLITANEGDAREYTNFVEESRVNSLTLDPTAFPNGSTLKQNSKLGRLNVTNKLGDVDNDGDFDKLYCFGGRSFSIWDAQGNLIFDSGAQLEQITANAFPTHFNSTNDANNTFDNRSDNKGPEPEGVVVANILNRNFAFIGLERIGGVVVYDITNPSDPSFVQYINSRDFSGNPAAGTAGDLGPEGLLFIPFNRSPNLKPLLVVGNEISGSISIFQVNVSINNASLNYSAEFENRTDKIDNDSNQENESLKEFSLNQNHPNPFNPSTTISFSIPVSGYVTLKVYDMLGNEVATLVNDNLASGTHGVDFNAGNLASGVYIYRLQSGNLISTKRLILLK